MHAPGHQDTPLRADPCGGISGVSVVAGTEAGRPPHVRLDITDAIVPLAAPSSTRREAAQLTHLVDCTNEM
jgi:hypothetical protein